MVLAPTMCKHIGRLAWNARQSNKHWNPTCQRRRGAIGSEGVWCHCGGFVFNRKIGYKDHSCQGIGIP